MRTNRPEEGWSWKDSIAEATRLTAPGLLGFYTHFEVTEVVAFPARGSAPLNVFTLVVAEDHAKAGSEQPRFLNTSRIKLANLRDWQFGIYRYSRRIDELAPALERAFATKAWDASGSALQIAVNATRPAQFVPPDSIRSVPWNNLLKNNFWNGSYVLEWSDTQKAALTSLFDEPRRLQVLSDAVGTHVPIRLASLSDRLGNLAVQLPISALMARFSELQEDAFVIETGWHPKATPRRLRAIVQIDFDSSVLGYMSRPVDGERTLLPMQSQPGTHHGVLWDEANSVILAATGPSAFIRTIAMNLRPLDPEPRVFALADENGVMQLHRVGVHQTVKSSVGSPENDGNGGWTQRRIYRDETSRLVSEHRFVQYRPEAGQKNIEHLKAINDIRKLISQHGEEGAWLWDPYLSARDILKTLFFCPHSSADLRGLTATEELPGQVSPTRNGDFLERQRRELSSSQSNLRGLKLEYRARTGSAGWAFHDRFLIFPRSDEAALAWSLGTSVNSVGKAHHILQRVDDGQQVMDAFVDLWDRLSGPDQLVWKTLQR